MLAKDTLPFEDAFGRFKASDQNLGQLTARLDDAKQKLLAARLELSGIGKRVEAFAADGKADVAEAGKLVAEETQARNVVALLERAIESLTRNVAEAKADVIVLERECGAAQTAYHSKVLDDLADEFLRSNESALAKLALQLTHCQAFDLVDQQLGNTASVGSVRGILMGVLVDALNRQGEAFANTPPGKSTPITTSHLSKHLSSGERNHGAMAVNRGGRAAAVIELTPKAEPEQPFDMTFAFASAREAALSAEHHRLRASEYQSRLETNPDDSNLKSAVEEHTREAKRYDGIVERWDNQIAQHQES